MRASPAWAEPATGPYPAYILPYSSCLASLPPYSARADFTGGALSPNLHPMLLPGDLQIGQTRLVAT